MNSYGDTELDDIRTRVKGFLVVFAGAALAQLLELLFSLQGMSLR